MIDWFLYHPDDPVDSRINVCSPAVVKLPFQSTFIKTADNVEINVVFIYQEKQKVCDAPTLVYFHGNAGNVGHRLLNVSEIYHNCGCNLLLVEYRGYGHSKGSPSESGLYMDAEAALSYLLEHPDVNKSKIVLFGRSLGGAVAVELCSNPNFSTHVSALIIENTFTSIPDVARILFDCRIVRLIPRWFYKSRFDSLSKISQVSVPTLFLSGLADELIPPSMMHSLYESSGSILKQFKSFDNGTHNFTWRCKDYYSVLNLFLCQSLQESNNKMHIVNEVVSKVNASNAYSTKCLTIPTNMLQVPSVLSTVSQQYEASNKRSAYVVDSRDSHSIETV
ncbi:alpha/beta hydrolase domain-containing protein 13-like protein [Leptotrombidium deliense]|uniref:Protein ABHD13 n=1 Tax=Leptotrombidium deliense TaxID=299467 RepID=A0A443SG90_9ACAR|nr:alpha/beta hydrolase domain-containing protein 13-like protein [Leptotrombidium deliense]